MATPRVVINSAALAEFLYAPGTGPVTRALILAAEDVFQTMKVRCPVSPHGSTGADGQHHPSGTLRSSLEARIVGQGPTLAAEVGSWTVDYATFVEYGTKPHDIRPKDSNGVLVFWVKGKKVTTKLVHHPGTRAQPFIRPALDILHGRTYRAA